MTSPTLSPVHGPEAAWDAIYDYRVEGSPPDEIAARLDQFLKGSSISFAASMACELAFALRATAPTDFLLVAANVAFYACQFGVDNMGGERGTAIRLALCRDAGVEAPAGMEWPDAASDPACRAEFDPTTPPPVNMPTPAAQPQVQP